MAAPEPDGEGSLMLCESILHLLVEEGVISKEKALDAIDGVVELARENEICQRRSTSRSAVQLIEMIAQTFALKGSDEVTSLPAERRGRGGGSKGAGRGAPAPPPPPLAGQARGWARPPSDL